MENRHQNKLRICLHVLTRVQIYRNIIQLINLFTIILYCEKRFVLRKKNSFFSKSHKFPNFKAFITRAMKRLYCLHSSSLSLWDLPLELILSVFWFLFRDLRKSLPVTVLNHKLCVKCGITKKSIGANNSQSELVIY